MQPIYVSKTLSAASSGGIGSISTAAIPVVTVNSSALDTGRRIVFTASNDASTLTLTFTGTAENRGSAIVEAVKGSTGAGTNATTLSDFTSVTAVSYSSAPNIPILIGTSSVGGTPWKIVDWTKNPIILGAMITFTTSANSMSGQIDMTIDDPTGTYPDADIKGPIVPEVFNSTSPVCTSVSTNSIGTVNVDGNTYTPIAAWRLTIISSATGAGTVYATVMQSG